MNAYNLKGPLEESAVTGHLEPQEAPAWKRRAFRYLVSFPIIGLCLLSVFVVMVLMLRLQVIYSFIIIRYYVQHKFHSSFHYMVLCEGFMCRYLGFHLH
jgi:hypothetical protein